MKQDTRHYVARSGWGFELATTIAVQDQISFSSFAPAGHQQSIFDKTCLHVRLYALANHLTFGGKLCAEGTARRKKLV